MSTYAPASSLGWLDFDDAARDRVSALLRSLEEPRTLDVLGLLTINNAFSEMLSPGTSTVQTKLRYFIFLPWIFQRLGAERVPPAHLAGRLREAEARLIECLRHLGRGQGVLGYHAGRKLKIMPSSIYWGGLGAWGIRHPAWSPADYARSAAVVQQQTVELDDDHNATARRASLWADMPPAPDDFLESDIDFKLSRDEAVFLIVRIRDHCPNTLLCPVRPARPFTRRRVPVGAAFWCNTQARTR